MKQILPLIIFSFLSVALFGQLEFENTEVNTDFAPEVTFDVDNKLPLTNVGDEDIEFIWNVVTESAPAEWKFYVCDLNKCYGPGTEYIDADALNTLSPDDPKEMRLHILPNGVMGEGTYVLNLTAIDDTEDVLASVTLNFNGTLVNAKEEQIAQLNIFPNPVDEYFELDNPSNIAQTIEIYDVLGKKVKSFETGNNKNYFIGDISAGRYFARIFDQDGSSLKVVRLVKR